MFKKDPNLRGIGEAIEMTPEQLQEYFRCKEDVFYFANYFYIVASDGEHPIHLREYQERLLKCIVTDYYVYDPDTGLPMQATRNDEKTGKPIVDPKTGKPITYDVKRNNRIFMMGRQTGKTTIATLYLLWYALFHESKIIAILANKESQALEIMLRIQSAYQQLPLWLQQGLKKYNQSEIIMENGTRMFAAASSSSSIRGKTVDLMLVDEFAHLDDSVATPFMLSVFPTQASRPDSMLLLISTPKGMNHFYEIWQKAKRGDSDFVPGKVQWYEIPGRDEAWKKRVIRDSGLQFFQQEYACLGRNSKITIKDSNGIIKQVKIGDLYDWEQDLLGL